MNLCVDIGNTRAKLAFFQGREICHFQIVEDLTKGCLDELQRSFPVERLIVSSVRKNQLNWGEWREKTLFLDHKTPLPIINRYKTPETLGDDRLAAVIGAYFQFRGPSLVVDAGTCIKFDFIDGNGLYLGGSIAPGIRMRFKALHTFTDQLPLVESKWPTPLSGGSTEESILSGVLNGVLAEVDGFIERYKREFGEHHVIFTGGDAQFFESSLKREIFERPNLILEGLNEILLFNIKNAAF